MVEMGVKIKRAIGTKVNEEVQLNKQGQKG
jgi:hypothetical protein